MMNKRWGFWTLWVSISAIASLIWGITFIDNFWPSIGGMLAGIGCFIVFYTLLDDFARKNQWYQFTKALQKAIYIKAGLQILNFTVFVEHDFAIYLSPEFWAGMGATYVFLATGLDSNNPFLLNLIMTLVTGALLSLLVGIISLIILFLSNLTRKKDITVNDVL